MHRNRLLIPAIFMSMIVAVAGSGAAGWNDADTGKDASGKRGDASRIAFGAYTGYLNEADDDWYRVVDDASAACVQARVAGTPTAEAMLEVQGQDTRRATLPWGGGESATIALATPRVADTYLHLEETGAVDQGGYEFELALTPAAGILTDTNTAGDAPSLRVDAVPIEAGCIGGRLGASGVLVDTSDVYRFTGEAGGVAVVSLVQDPVEGLQSRVQILDSAGDVLLTVAAGDLSTVELPYDGTYYMSTSTTSLSTTEDVSYLVGITIGPPGGGPCRPACLDGVA